MPGPVARIVHLDDRLAVLAKPPGLSLATPRDRNQDAVSRLVAALPDEERELLAGRDLHLVHRLDAPTSGLVLVALDADEHRRLVGELSERRIVKTYLAVVWGRPRPAAGRFEDPLGPDRTDRRRMRVDPAGRPAVTERVVLASGSFVSLVALRPRTGRTHQLRVHLASAGHPIVGDDLYGGPRHRGVRRPALRAALDPGRALLHAWRLELPDRSPSRFEVAPPADFEHVLAACGLDLGPAAASWRLPGGLDE